jgi:hypothetical protein
MNIALKTLICLDLCTNPNDLAAGLKGSVPVLTVFCNCCNNEGEGEGCRGWGGMVEVEEYG